MARPLAFGVRLRDKNRTLRLRNDARNPEKFVVEDARTGRAQQRSEHDSLAGALRQLASSWRNRLN